MSHETNPLAQIHRQIMWNRLIAVVEEQAQTMIRTAFSTTVREAGDLSAGIFDLQGRMMAQAVTGTPGHVNSMAESVGHFLRKFPTHTMQPGDHYITNDPWLGTGHLHDLTVVTPAFHNGHIVGLFANTAHVIDVGGLGMGPEGRSVFEEGMYIPIVKCFDQGRANETFFDIVRAGSRLPVELEGDIYSLCACNDAGAHRLVAMMAEFEMDSLDPLATFIFDSSQRATLAEIARIPKGTYRAEISSDGYEAPVTLKAEMTILDDGIEVDYAGTSGLSSRGINVPPAYCRAYSCFGIKCVVAPEIPNNWASLAPFRMKIPEGCILNAPRPYPVSVRHVIGHLLPDLMMGCLHQAVPDRVTAEGASALWNPPLRGGSSVSGQARGNRPVIPDFEIITFNSGGTGARPTSDGLNATAFPSGVRTMPVEATENVAPIIFWTKELRPDSGGAGRTRGGTGQIMEVGAKGDLEFAVNATFDRIANAPKGREGGLDGAPGVVALKSGKNLRTKGFQIIPDGDRLILKLPGGAGMGDPTERDPALVARDVRDGLVSSEVARTHYKVAVDAHGTVDASAARPARGVRGPLARFKVLDLSRVRAGPTAVRQLADWGADVIKIESPEGDAGMGGERHGPDFQNLHRNKRSMTLNLKSPEGVAILKRLVSGADVLVENYRPDVKFRLGIDYATLRSINPQLVYASISGFGQDGPYRERPGFDQIAQGMGGLMSITGLPGQGPVRVGIPVADLTAGIFCAMGIMVALLEREVSGEGQWVQSNLLAAQIAMLDFQAARWTIGHEVPGQAGNDHPTSIPTGAFPTSDGYFNIGAAGEAIYRRFCAAIDAPQLASDPDFATNADRSKNRHRLHEAISAITRKHTSAEWIDLLNEAGVPCGPIYKMDEVFADPQVRHLNVTRHVQHKVLGDVEVVGQAVELSRTPWTVRSATPEPGEHTDEVLRELGFGEAEIGGLRERGVV